MFDELSKSVKAQLYDRVSSPLMGTFIISWAICNYRFVLALTSSMTFADKITYIDKHLFPTWSDCIWHGFAMPAFAAVLIIFAYPYPARWVYEYHRRRLCELKRIQQQIDDDTPLTQEEARKLRLASMESERRFAENIKAKDDEIENLRSILDMSAEGERRHDPGVVSEVAGRRIPVHKVRLSEAAQGLLDCIAEYADGVAKSVIHEVLEDGDDSYDRVKVDHWIDLLLQYDLIKTKGNEPNTILEVTPRGRKFLVGDIGI